jgi:hypothetical protein
MHHLRTSQRLNIAHLRRSYIYTCGRIHFTPYLDGLMKLPPAEFFYQLREFQQIRKAEKRTMPAHDDLRIGSNVIRPLWRDRANGYIIDAEQQTLSIAVVPLTYAWELFAAERMERMRYPHKARGCNRLACISDGATSVWRRDGSVGRRPLTVRRGSYSVTRNWRYCWGASIWRRPGAGDGIEI